MSDSLGISSRLVHHGAAATSSSKAVVCISSTNELVYASHAMINVANCHKLPVGNQMESVWSVSQTLRTSSRGSALATTTVATQTAKRVITCLSQVLDDVGDEKITPMIVVGFSDGTITSWTREKEGSSWKEQILLDPHSFPEVCDGRSITDIAGRLSHYMEAGHSTTILEIVACSSGGAHYYNVSEGRVVTSHHSLVHTPANTVRFQHLAPSPSAYGTLLLLIGTAAPRHNKIHVFVQETIRVGKELPHYCGALVGHEDWITCFDWFASPTRVGNDCLMLASGSADAKIRLWKFSTNTTQRQILDTTDTPELEESSDNGDEDEGDGVEEREAEEEGESRMEIVHSDSLSGDQQFVTSVTLEALLIGHEERITSVSWHPNPKPLYGQEMVLISSSMDRTIYIWGENEETGVWTPVSRVGSAGGILGGSIGSSLLGFLNTQLEPKHGRWLMGHGYGGALHFFSCEMHEGDVQLNHASTVEERAALIPWKAQPCVTGHFDAVTDLCWEANSGEYLITVSNDHTCRLWHPLASDEANPWIEITRPQVHGYYLSAVTSLSTSEHPHLLVSGADEKEIRVFDGTATFTKLLGLLENDEPLIDDVDRVDRAFIPALGLTNKATAADGAEQDMSGVSEPSTQLPLERDLGALSQWPETLKLYGHNTELVRLTSTLEAQSSTLLRDDVSGKYACDLLVASSAKARDVDAANIRLWDVKGNSCVHVLSGGHKSTVTALCFSPNGQFLASSGKDRRLCIWRRREDAREFFLDAAIDSAHKRIIWGVHFCPYEPNILASGSRDGTVKIWRLCAADHEEEAETNMQEIFSFHPVCKQADTGKAESITSLAFAPRTVGSTAATLLALGLENGLLELWRIPLDTDPGHYVPTLELAFPPEQCHISTVTKLAWRPHRTGSSDILTLASCSTDHGCRIYQIDS